MPLLRWSLADRTKRYANVGRPKIARMFDSTEKCAFRMCTQKIMATIVAIQGQPPEPLIGWTISEEAMSAEMTTNCRIDLTGNQQILSVRCSQRTGRVIYSRRGICTCQLGKNHRHDRSLPKSMNLLLGRIRKQVRMVLPRLRQSPRQRPRTVH